MPSRIIREDILTSEKVDSLDFPEEVFYRRLMSKVDDHGAYDARTSILKAHLYPLRIDRVREADITRWMAACQKAGLIALYFHDGKPYLQMLNTKWTVRSEPKYPLQTTANNCTQLKTPVLLDVVVDVVVDEGVDKPGSDEPPPRKPGRQKSEAVTLQAFIDTCREAGETAIPRDGPVFAYAERVGLPEDYVVMAWRWFKARFGPDGKDRLKRQKDWRAHFRNAVEGGWPKFWAIDQSGTYYLTTAGKQAQREMQSEESA